MRTQSRTVLAWSLVACLLLLSGLGSRQTVPHAVHHAHHNAATHATALCAWLCAAGQSIESVAIIFQSGLQPFGRTALTAPQLLVKASLSPLLSRGPPLF